MSQADILGLIPTPETVRAQLGSLVRQRVLLKSLLRLAEQKRAAEQRERLQAGEGQAVGS